MKNKHRMIMSVVIMGLLMLTGCSSSGNDKEVYGNFKENYEKLYQERKKDYEENDYNQKFEDSYFDISKIDELPIVIYKHEQRNEYVVKVVEDGMDYHYSVVVDKNKIATLSSVDYDKAIKVDGVKKVYERK